MTGGGGGFLLSILKLCILSENLNENLVAIILCNGIGLCVMR